MTCVPRRTTALVVFLACLLAAPPRPSQAASEIVVRPEASIVAAESVYADIARQVAGPQAHVIAILTNPTTDPHSFEATPSTARAVADAALVLSNGAGYDPWIGRLTPAAVPSIVVADLLHRQPGDNPHLWYDPQSGPALARALADALIRADPASAAAIRARSDRLLASLTVLQARIARLRARFAGTRVAATEPVFGLMIRALGLDDAHARFELAVMNGAEPRASDVAALQDDLHAHRVRALITNAQASSPASTRLVALARAASIPVVPVTETLPSGQSYQSWVSGELDALDAALSLPAPR